MSQVLGGPCPLPKETQLPHERLGGYCKLREMPTPDRVAPPGDAVLVAAVRIIVVHT